MALSVTIVTAFFDIDREHKGDGRSINDYLQWIKKTLKLNCFLYIITENKFFDYINTHRPIEYKHKTIIKIDTFENALYYKYLDRIREICNSSEYKSKIMHPNRVECILPEYNVIQYSKFGWLIDCIRENPFNSRYFFWMDIGISRFFENFNLANAFPNPDKLNQLLQLSKLHQFIIQKRADLDVLIEEDIQWRSDNLLKGGMFGGTSECIHTISEKLEHIFKNDMLDHNNVNNEQIALSLLYKKEPELFYLIADNNKPCNLLSSLF